MGLSSPGLLRKALTRVLKGSSKVCAAGRGLYPLPFEVGNMVRGLYSVVNIGSGRISAA